MSSANSPPENSSLAPLPLKVIEGVPSSFPFGELKTSPAIIPPETDRMKQLEQMLHEAQGRAGIIEKEAYDKAYRAGEKTGIDLGKKRAEQFIASMETLLRQSEDELARMHGHINETVLEIADAVIHHVVGTMVEDHPGYLKQMVEQCAQRLPAYDTLKLAVAPENMSMIETLLENGLQDNTSQDIRLIPDDSVRPGTCRIMAETNDILIDPHAAITECMQHIRDKMLVKHEFADTSDRQDSSLHDS